MPVPGGWFRPQAPVLNAMRQQLIVILGIFLALFSPVAMAQSSSSTGDLNSNSPYNQTPTVDCTDPLMANSTECQSTTQGYGNNNQTQQNSGQQQGISPQVSPNAIPQPNMTQPQTYSDLGNQNNPMSRYSSTQNQKPLPPQPLTEFQKFVAGTTGQVLPVFGANLFLNAPSTFAPIDETPVPPDYLIGPGDELRIRIWGQVNFDADVMVDRSGDIYLPQVGRVHVSGLPYQALSQHLHDSVGRVFRNFNLTSDIGQIRAVQVYVTGLAQRPGTYTISSLSTLVDALFASGGPSVQGSMRHIYLKRDGKTVADFDLYDLLVNGDKSKDAKLQSGDVISIPPAGPQVAMTGAVRIPAIFELRDGDTLGKLLKYAGGAATTASSSARISVERIENGEARAAMEVAFDPQGLSTVLQQGDILRVLSVVPMYQQTVTLRGNLANPGRFAWHAGMRLSDLIPDRASLLTRDYWWQRAQAGLPTPDFEPVPMLAAQSQPSYPVDLRTRAKNFPQSAAECRAYNGAYDSNWYQCNQYDYGSGYGNNNGANGVQNQSQIPGQGPDQNNGQYSQYGQQGQLNQPSQYGSTQYDQLYGSNLQNGGQLQPGLSANQEAGSGTLAGRQNQVITENTAKATQHTRVELPAPEIDWDYAVIERLDKNTLKTSLIPFDLGKLVMDHDPSQNLLLEPGDVVSIFSQADINVPVAEQTKFVKLEGEFVHAGTYSVKPGETLQQLVARAGGLTPDAYLYGSEFTRESTRVIQQQRMDEYVQNLQLEINRGALAQSSSAVTSTQDIASSNAALVSEHELISKLLQIRATGRIVLAELPSSVGAAALPPIQLQDGDRFVVPPRPASVNVVGSVYDQNSFLFIQRGRVGDYLHLAGGPNRDADTKHAFLIRPDGSVLSRSAANSVWGNTFGAIPVQPGDTLVVPEKTFRPSSLRGVLEWSQLFSQLALGVAAISIIN